MAAQSNDDDRTAAYLRIGETVFAEGRFDSGTFDAYAVSIGARTTGKAFVEGAVGAAYLDRVPDGLCGHGQFLLSVGVGFRFDPAAMVLRARHYSNGSDLGIGAEPNLGLDHAFIGIERKF